MRALLIQHGCEATLEVLPADMEAEVKSELNKKAHSAVILCLVGRKIYEHIDEFNKIILDLANIKVKFEDGDLALLLLTSLPASYEHFVGTLLYGREALTLKDVMATLNSKKIKERSKAKGVMVKGYMRGEELMIGIHNNRKKSIGCVKKDDQPSSSGSIYDDSDLMMVMSAEDLLDWIIDSGCLYHMTPRRVYVYILKFKHEAIGKFKEWKQLVKNQTGRTVKKLMMDNSLGFCNQEFEQLCIESGIARHLTIVGTPQHNELAECMNRTSWIRSPSTAIEKKTPMKIWSGHPSDYGMLRIFSCVAYSHIKHGKLEPRAVKCVLLVYPEGVKGYILYRLGDESPKIVASRNVIFNESVMYKDTLKDSEMDSLRKNKTWELVDHPAGKKLVSCKWLFKIKERIEGVQKPRYKARLVAHRFTHRAGIDYNELDVKTTFLHENLEEVIYMRQPPGYEQGNKVYLLKKSLYGLKQSPMQWLIGSTKSLLKKEFKMKELEESKKILSMEIVKHQSRKILRVSQSGYVSKILNTFIIDDGKSVQMPLGGHFKLSLKDCPVRDCDVERMSKVPYANAVGSLMYLMVCTRPDIAYAVCIVSRYLANPGKTHWEAVKWILKYLRGTANVSLVHGKNRGSHVNVTGFVDSDYAKDPDKEAEYMAFTEAVKEANWLRGLLEELGVELNIVAVNCDKHGAIHLSRNPVFHERTKFFNVRYHFIRDVLETKTVKV
nr:retrovirus-related Pol polyprotein from transposon TNT 1-94 [Tanacetum cinerariifolium]